MLPSLSRLGLSPRVATAPTAVNPFSVAVARLEHGDDVRRAETLSDLLREELTGARAAAFVDAGGMRALVATLRTASEESKRDAYLVAYRMLDYDDDDEGHDFVANFIANDGVTVIMHEMESGGAATTRAHVVSALLNVVFALSSHPAGRVALYAKDGIVALAKVVCELGLDGNDGQHGMFAMRCLLMLVFDTDTFVTWPWVVDISDLTGDALASILIVDGTWTTDESTLSRAVYALSALTRSEGGEHELAVQTTLVGVGVVGALLRTLGRGGSAAIDVEIEAILGRMTACDPELQPVIDDSRGVLASLRATDERFDAFVNGKTGTAPVLSADACEYATTSDQSRTLSFILLGGLETTHKLLTNGAVVAALSPRDRTQLVQVLRHCFVEGLYVGERPFVYEIAPSYPHPLSNDPSYSDLLPVLLPMLLPVLHDDGSPRDIARHAVMALERLSVGPVVAAMRTDATIMAHLIACLRDYATSLSGMVLAHSLLAILLRVTEGHLDATRRFVREGGVSVVNACLASTSERNVSMALGLVRNVATTWFGTSLFLVDDGAPEADDDPWSACARSLVALLEPGRLAVGNLDRGGRVVECLMGIVTPRVPEGAQDPATIGATFDAVVDAGGVERLVPLLIMDPDGGAAENAHSLACELLRRMMNGVRFGWARATNAIARFAIGGGVEVVVRERTWRSDRANDRNYLDRMVEHSRDLYSLRRILLSGAIPSWIPMLTDVTQAIADVGVGRRDEHPNVWRQTLTLPPERWNDIEQLRSGVGGYGQIYDLLAQYRGTLRASEGDVETAVLRDSSPFGWMDDEGVLLHAALWTTTLTDEAINHKPSLLAAERWIVLALAEVIETNVPVPIADGGFTQAQIEQVARYGAIRDAGERLTSQYARASMVDDAVQRVNEQLEVLVQAIDRPKHADGSWTVMHHHDVEQVLGEGVVKEGDERKRKREPATDAALRASVATLYGAAQTDATMERLFARRVELAT